ncbi:MAG: hypothetical protein ACXWMU_05695 [Candidatus Limnocylindrales bacterium]
MNQRDPTTPRAAPPAPGGPSSAESLALPVLPIVGITRRRAAFLIAAAMVLWIVAIFARQVADASAAVSRADALRSQNGTLVGEVSTLQRERVLVQSKAFVEQQARAYGLGSTKEHPFALAPDASRLAADAPGSAAVRLGIRPEPARSPLESWLELLFGPAPA